MKAPDPEYLALMALRNFGFGRWDADYWFIGPEQGDDKNGTLPARLDAWTDQQQEGLCDCLAFHDAIKEYRWHGSAGKKPQTQPTWRKLIRLLLVYKSQLKDYQPSLEDIREYQRTLWGRRSGETCVLELSGIPAHSYAIGAKLKNELFTTDQLKAFVDFRIKEICGRIAKRSRPLKLLVMYGDRDRAHWQRITDFTKSLPADKRPATASLTHPTYTGITTQYWEKWGGALRDGERRSGDGRTVCRR